MKENTSGLLQEPRNGDITRVPALIMTSLLVANRDLPLQELSFF